MRRPNMRLHQQPTAPDHENGVIHASEGAEGRPREPQPEVRLERLGPPAIAGSPCAGPPFGGLPLEDQVGGGEATSRLEEPS